MHTDLLGISFSARLTDLLVSIGCTGFSPQPSVIYDRSDRKVVCADAKWTQFQRGCGEPDRERGYDPGRPFTRPDVVGLFFDHSTWTGLDIFRPVGSSAVVITDRIAKAIQGADLRGYLLVRAEEYGRDMVDAINLATGRKPGEPPSPPPPPTLADLQAAAAAFRLVSHPNPRATPHYDMPSMAIAWTDEHPRLPRDLSRCVRVLWRCRTCRFLGIPDEHLGWWDRAVQLFPEWVGFLPERTSPCKEVLDLCRQGEALFGSRRRGAGGS